MTRLGVTSRVAALVLERDGETCIGFLTHEGARSHQQLHHRLPRQMGGSRGPEVHTAANLLSLCSDCHTWVERHREEAYAYGWLVHRGDSPEQVAVLWRRQWARLAADGSVELLVSPS